ncbi:MAG: hypothetical protein FOGNACKC_03760 [Anaerolineae bacterium]|nr:hypothetical protein [Anaerolineae bacterium]
MTAGRKRLHHRAVDIDQCGFVYVGGIKFARYYPERATLEFINHSATRHEPGRFVEVDLLQFTAELQRLSESR